MPYILKKVKNGFKVCKKNEPKICFSNKPLTEEKAKKQKTAIILSELRKAQMVGGLKPLTARVGGKVLLKKQIVNKYFPKADTYTTYVEPFVGGGSVYFFKNKNNHKEIINDIDPDIYTIFKGFQDYDADRIADAVNGDYTKKDFEKILETKPSNDFEKFIKTFLVYRLSYFGRGKTFGKPRINANFRDYKERLEGVTILNKDYKDVIKQYDGPNTFFYLDPPIRESSSSFYYPRTEVEDLLKVLKSIKGKFLLSWADTKVKKDLFREFNVYDIKTRYVGEKTLGSQKKVVREFLVSNYTPPNTGSGSPMDKLVGGGTTLNQLLGFKDDTPASILPGIDQWQRWMVQNAGKLGGYTDSRGTIPALADFVNSLTSPQDLISLFNKFIEAKVLDDRYKSTRDPRTWVPRTQAWVSEVASNAENIREALEHQYDEANQVFEQVKGGNTSGLEKAIQGAMIMANAFQTLKSMTPVGALLEAGQSLYSFITFFTSGDFNKPPENVSFSYADQMANDVSKFAGPLAGTMAKAFGSLLEAFGMKSEAKMNEHVVRAIIDAKKRDAFMVLDTFLDAVRQEMIGVTARAKIETDKIDKMEAEKAQRIADIKKKQEESKKNKKTSNDLYQRWMNEVPQQQRLSPTDYKGVYGREKPSNIPTITFEDWKSKQTGSGRGGMDKFHKQLEEVGLDHNTYMEAVKVLAKRNGYDPKLVEMSDDGVHKLVYHSPEGLKRFGRVGYGDFIIWSFKEYNKKVPEGYADQKRKVFRMSHGKIKDSGKYSPNQLSINLLW